MGDSASEPRFFLQFAGQGMKYMEEMRRIWTSSPAVQPFIEQAVAAVQHQAAHYDDSVTQFHTHGFDVLRWINEPASTPPWDYLLYSPVSHPLIYVCQVANYLALLEDGVDRRWLQAHTVGTTGFSTGIVAALVSSLDLPKPQLWDKAVRVAAMFFWQGIRSQDAMRQRGVHPRLDAALHESERGCPSAMARLTGVTRSRIDALLTAWGNEGRLHVAYVLNPTACIVSGSPEHLEQFSVTVAQAEPELTWRYVNSTIAAHSPYMQFVYDTVPGDAAALGLTFDRSELAVPVTSNRTGADLRESDDIIRAFLQGYALDTGYWGKQLGPCFSGQGATHVLDFGPGTGMASLSETYVARRGIEVIRLALPLGRMQLRKVIEASA
jgi:malonyl CoA-acyl carrier protein transacylase